MEGFEFIQNESGNNLNNGIYPTLSANGLVQNNVSYGSLDTAMWVAGSENVRVIGNEVFDSVIGFEITVSNNVWVTQNKIHDNTVGIGLFHPDGAGNPPKPVMANWVIEHNDVRDNNLPNKADAGTFQSKLPPGIGILLLGVSDHVIAKNVVENNDFVGIAVLGWCTANSLGDPQLCPIVIGEPPREDPSVARQPGLPEQVERQRQRYRRNCGLCLSRPWTFFSCRRRNSAKQGLATASRRTSRAASRTSPPPSLILQPEIACPGRCPPTAARSPDSSHQRLIQAARRRKDVGRLLVHSRLS